MQQPSSSSPSSRPRSIAELAQQAQKAQYYDASKPIKEILIGASHMRKQGEQFMRDGDLETAFINLARAATIVAEKLPQHAGYRDLTPTHRQNLKLNGEEIMTKLGQLKPMLSDRFEKYQSKEALATAASERVRAAREAQAREVAERRDQRDAVKQQEEEDAAARTRHAAAQQALASREREKAALRHAEEARRRQAEEQARRDYEASHAAREAQRRSDEADARRRHDQDVRIKQQEQEASRRRQQEQSQKTWDVSGLNAAIGSQGPPPIAYKAPRKDDDFLLPLHPLENPSSTGEDSSSEYGGIGPYVRQHVARRPPPGRGNPIEPITTTSPPPPDVKTIEYPDLMDKHQLTQGYAPSLQSMFIQAGRPPSASAALELSLEPGPPSALYSYPLPPPSRPYGASVPQSQSIVQSQPPQPWHPRDHVSIVTPASRQVKPNLVPVRAPLPTPPPPRGPPVVKASELPPSELRSLSSSELKSVTFPREVLPRFVSIAAYNTSINRETCGLLLGRQKKNGKYVVTTLLIPKQRATSDTCMMEEEILVVEFQLKRELITLGWIHTHPTQSCFMSSVDLHTHSAYQSLLPEAFAVVCAPASKPNFGIFRLTDPPGLQTITSCHIKEAFHPHPDVPIYTDADKGHVQMQDLPLEIADLR